MDSLFAASILFLPWSLRLPSPRYAKSSAAAGQPEKEESNLLELICQRGGREEASFFSRESPKHVGILSGNGIRTTFATKWIFASFSSHAENMNATMQLALPFRRFISNSEGKEGRQSPYFHPSSLPGVRLRDF